MAAKLDKITENVVKLLVDRNMTLATAESCTGGLISERITSVSGASSVFGFGVCSYANEAKMKLLGVRAETLSKYGAVSEETAKEMAEGVRKLSGADFGISVSGIAGPTGGTPDKPVGTVCIGISTAEETKAVRCFFEGKEFPETANMREAIRYETAYTALSMIYNMLKERS